MKNTVNLGGYNNSNFNTGSGPLKRIVWHFVNGLFFKSFFHFYGLKVFLLKLFGAEIGMNVLIKPNVNIKYPWNLIVGNDVWIGEEVWIDNLAKVQIGNNVCISQWAMLLCGNHNFSKSNFDLITGTIILEDGVWIGARSVVCPHVTCHSHSVLSVNSTATKDLEPYSIYQGTPAVKIRDRIIT